ncbi:helix-turn-helix domain-containing protein [Synechococcales cyanobacterium C]|uniref:Helix-turn-helix domain-containing protein n=1 Tax=Petrachloros mirabilis ULC683 TaxID=2781853 RepID=A0A8K2A9B7_9CYAN|nr:helix-turn-helix domain-containing protein [Petrachloros mirabilis]NCJ07880.1 helix-turn-helix domain-containing protein [Petrachloros mirabilis ULC683]
MKAYTIDLRQKIIDTYESEPISQRELAKRFRVAPSFVVKLLKQYRETGQLAPKSRPGRPRLLDAEQMQVVQDLVEAKNDITLEELCSELHQQFELTVSNAYLHGFGRSDVHFGSPFNMVA